jgi:hypothetical protein
MCTLVATPKLIAMASPTIYQPNDIDVNNIQFGMIKQLSNGGRQIGIKYNNNKLYLQTPEMRAPFGMNVWLGENGNPPKYDISLAFENDNCKPIMKALETKLREIDEHMIKSAMTNSEIWFNGKRYVSDEVVRELYTKTTKESKNGQYAPTIKLSLPVYEGKFQFKTFGKGRSEIDLMDMFTSGPLDQKDPKKQTPIATRGSSAQAIIQLTGIWVVSNKFGLTWKVRQLKLAPVSSGLPKHAFLDMGSESLDLGAEVGKPKGDALEDNELINYDEESDSV